MNQVEINKDIKLSPHFTLGELTKTSYHTLDGNIPSHVAIENLRRLCQWLELLRQYSEAPVIISSGFRSEAVNMKCGGAKNSNHLTGCAVDICCDGPEQMIIYAAILLNISHSGDSPHCENFDELILEKRGTTYWVHFAVRPKDNRRKILFDCR